MVRSSGARGRYCCGRGAVLTVAGLKVSGTVSGGQCRVSISETDARTEAVEGGFCDGRQVPRDAGTLNKLFPYDNRTGRGAGESSPSSTPTPGLKSDEVPIRPRYQVSGQIRLSINEDRRGGHSVASGVFLSDSDS